MSDPDKQSTSDEMLARVLGPGVPELTCEECFALLDGYVELTISDDDPDERVPGMRAHLSGCPACAEDFESLCDLVAQERDS